MLRVHRNSLVAALASFAGLVGCNDITCDQVRSVQACSASDIVASDAVTGDRIDPVDCTVLRTARPCALIRQPGDYPARIQKEGYASAEVIVSVSEEAIDNVEENCGCGTLFTVAVSLEPLPGTGGGGGTGGAGQTGGAGGTGGT